MINRISGSIIRSVYNGNIPFRKTKIYVSDSLSPMISAMLFFENYESAEIRFVNKYLDPKLDVIEIGSSIGGVSCQIGKKLNNYAKLVCVEANTKLIDNLKKNIHTNHISAIVVNKAIGREKHINFEISDNNLISHEKHNNNTLGSKSETLELETISLQKLLDDYHLTTCSLVCDIEGAEINLLIEEPEVFKNIRSIIIELHTANFNNKSYEILDLVKLIQSLDFHEVDNYGNVYYFVKN